MRVTEQYFWNFIFSLFFIVLVIMATIILEGEAYKTADNLTILDIVLIILASMRLVRLMVYDKISAFFREQFWDAKVTKTSVALVKPEGGPRRTLADLLSCPWCIGVWSAAMVTFFYLLTPYMFYVTFLLAVSAVASTLQLLANFIGWKAEEAKNKVEGF